MPFVKAQFSIATKTGVEVRKGYCDATLGLAGAGGWWRITHLNTGFLVMRFKAKKAEALATADVVAALDCWDFTDIRGWKNRDPHLPVKIEAIYRAIGQPKMLVDLGPEDDHAREAAAEVLRQREEAI